MPQFYARKAALIAERYAEEPGEVTFA